MFTNSSLGCIKYKKKLKQTILFKITKAIILTNVFGNDYIKLIEVN